MPRNGHATKRKNEPDDHYDDLSHDAQLIWDEIGSLGYRIKQAGEGYEAYKPGAKEVAGPCDALEVLLGEVKRIEAMGNTERSTVIDMDIEEDDASNETENPAMADETTAGDGILFPEMRPTRQKEIPDLNKAIMNYESFKSDRLSALARELEYKEEVEGLMRGHRTDLAFDPKTGIRSYRYNDYIEELVPGEEKLKSRKGSDEDE